MWRSRNESCGKKGKTISGEVRRREVEVFETAVMGNGIL